MPVPDPRGNGRGKGAAQLVVTDLDGTLSDAAERIHPASVRAIRDLEAAGIPVLVATGRRLRMAGVVLEAGGPTGPGGGRGGAPGGAAPARPRLVSWPPPSGSPCGTAGSSTRSPSLRRRPARRWTPSAPPGSARVCTSGGPGGDLSRGERPPPHP